MFIEQSVGPINPATIPVGFVFISYDSTNTEFVVANNAGIIHRIPAGTGTVWVGGIAPPVNYPVAQAGQIWNATTAGQIGGAGGPNMVIGDTLRCIADTAGGNQAAAGASFIIGEFNVDWAAVVITGGAISGVTVTNSTLAGTITFDNAGAGANPIFTSNSATQVLDLAGRLVVDSFEIDNQGAGTNPILSSNNVGQVLDITGSVAISAALTLGTDLALTEGGTGASDAATARTNLGLGIADTVTHNILALNAAANQIVLDADAATTTTLTAPAPVASRIYTIPDVGANTSFAMLAGAQSFTGVKSFLAQVILSTAGNNLTASNTADAASVQVAYFEGDRATVADGDTAYISFQLSDSGGTQDEGARIAWQATTVLAGATQDTDLILYALRDNVLTVVQTLDGSVAEVVFAWGLNLAGVTSPNLGTVTTAVINGGTLNGVVIGGVTAAAATVTTLSVNADSIIFDADDAGGFTTTLTQTATAARIINLPDGAGTLSLRQDNLSVFAATTSAQLAGVISDETGGGGVLVFNISPILTTPDINAGTVDSLTSLSIRSTGAAQDLTITTATAFTAGRTLTINPGDAARIVTLTGDPTLVAGTMAITGGTLAQFAATTSLQLAGVISDETGSGALVFATTPTLVTPVLGAATATSVISSVGNQATSTNRTATVDGLTTGAIAANTSIVSASSADANNIITLPSAVVGMHIRILTGGTGCELRTVAASNETINNVDSDGTNELALAANSSFEAYCTTATAWIVTGRTNLGADLAALVPDAA